MAIIDAPIWNANGEKIFAYQYKQKHLSSNTQLNVGISQEAIFIYKNEIKGKYGPGLHTLDTANLPGLRRLFGIPFGGNNPYIATVWYINKADILNVNCVTGMFVIKDASFPRGCPLIAQVNYGIRISEAEPFLLHLVNDTSPFFAHHLEEHLKGRIEREITSKIAQYADTAGLSYPELNGRKALLSNELQSVLAPFVAQYGLEFVDMNVNKITIDTSEEGKQIASGFGYDAATFQQSRLLDIQEKAIDNMSSGEGGMLGALVAMGMMNNMNAPASPSYPSPAQATPQPVAAPIRTIYCSNCAKKFPSTMNFCPHCGNKYRPCPKCGSDNAEKARRCVNCGTPLTSASAELCPHCGTQVPEGSKFCPACGHLMSEGRCVKCKTPLNGATYCPACGYKN